VSVLITIAGIVTPLGLYQEIVASKAIDSPFQYLKDFSPFGYGTPPRSNLSFSRQCGASGFLLPCPFSSTVPLVQPSLDNFTNASIITYPYGYDMTIPQILMEIYSSGVGNDTTVSNFFDIQYRQYSTASDPKFNNRSTYETGAFRYMETLILNNAYVPVDGLIVDMINGGIGFRNHTFPQGFQYGVTWTEDILFVEPETVCVDTNLTINFTVSASSAGSVEANSNIQNLVLVDRGGFVNLDHNVPVVDVSNPQHNPDLFARAYAGAWWNNYYTALYYNITNYKPNYDPTNNSVSIFDHIASFMDQSLPLPDPSNTSAVLNNLQFTAFFGDYLFLEELPQTSGLNITGNFTPSPPPFQSPPNPWNISTANLTEACKSFQNCSQSSDF